MNQMNTLNARNAFNINFMPKAPSTSQENTGKNGLESFAEGSGLAIAIVDENSTETSIANNNSMCRALYSSEEFAPHCARFCGRAFEMAAEAGKTFSYECHAGLNCLAVPLKTGEKPLVAIIGRAFLKAENYRKATERAIDGDWKNFPPSKFFENVLLTGSAQNLEKVAKRLGNFSDEELRELLSFKSKHLPDIEESPGKTGIENHKTQTESISDLIELFHREERTQEETDRIAQKQRSETDENKAWRAFFGSLLSLQYHHACANILEFLAKRYKFSALAWLESRNGRLETVEAYGVLKTQPFQINLPADDERLADAFRREAALELREKQADKKSPGRQMIQLFPVAVGGEIRSALIVADKIEDEIKKHHIARFCQSVASELEILRLREEILRQNWLETAIRKFNESLKNIDDEDFWTNILQISAELMQAERGSLLVFDEKTDELCVKAAIGTRAGIIKNEKDGIGEKIARQVLLDGTPMIVSNIETSRFPSAPSEWQYKTKSFISYPIIIGERKIGVLNLADKADGGSYDKFDLQLLQAIMPQIAIVVDRTTLKHKAGEYEQLSVTDALTGLLNRRYLVQRLEEETKRSLREGYAMSFMMIDADDFKSYNDSFGHPEGDKTLQTVAHALREALRDADVAARYGGEEFSILLPQTTSDDARTIAERIRQKIEITQFPHRRVTVSIGIASCSLEICTPAEIIKAADYALYEAKRRGRNNVQVYENLITPNNAEE